METVSQFGVLFLLLSVLFIDVKAQFAPGDGFSGDDAVSNFQPSLAVVIGILSIMFSLTFLLLIYAKFCHRRVSSVHGDPQNTPTGGGLVRTRSRFSGIDKTVIESLPFFRFSSLRGAKEGLECSVCLSKFEDIEILRMLPKCKHAFHIDCIDHWLERHSSCPLCRHRVSAEDPTIFTYSNSMRLLSNQPGQPEESNLELFVQREESHHGSSRFSIGSSFRRIEKGSGGNNNNKDEEEELVILKEDVDDEKKVYYHRHKHKIVVSDFVFKNRWSNVSSSDLMFLKSEMLGAMSSNRFSSLEASKNTRPIENEQIQNIKEEVERKRLLESKVSDLNKIGSVSSSRIPSTSASDSTRNSGQITRYVNPREKRSVSEITAVSRFEDLGMKNRISSETSLREEDVKEERMRQLWLPIARRTVQWFVNREERRSQQPQNSKQPLDV